MLVSAVFFLVCHLSQRQAEQLLKFLRELGLLPYVREACLQGNFGVPSLLRDRFFACRQIFWEPSMTHSCELSRARGCRSRPEVLLPGDSAHVCTICS